MQDCMKMTETVRELWTGGYFRKHKSSKDVSDIALSKYGCTSSNTTAILNACKFLRKEKDGWIQKTRYSSEEHESTSKKDSIKNLLDNENLWSACKSSFENGDYWDACSHAFRHLETKIRERAELSANDIGTDLVNKAFAPNTGILKIPSCATRSEEEGFHAINRGVVLFHRNAKGHREGSVDKKNAAKIICYVDYILEILKTAQKRTN